MFILAVEKYVTGQADYRYESDMIECTTAIYFCKKNDLL